METVWLNCSDISRPNTEDVYPEVQISLTKFNVETAFEKTFPPQGSFTGSSGAFLSCHVIFISRWVCCLAWNGRFLIYTFLCSRTTAQKRTSWACSNFNRVRKTFLFVCFKSAVHWQLIQSISWCLSDLAVSEKPCHFMILFTIEAV